MRMSASGTEFTGPAQRTPKRVSLSMSLPRAAEGKVSNWKAPTARCPLQISSAPQFFRLLLALQGRRSSFDARHYVCDVLRSLRIVAGRDSDD